MVLRRERTRTAISVEARLLPRPDQWQAKIHPRCPAGFFTHPGHSGEKVGRGQTLVHLLIHASSPHAKAFGEH